MVPRLFCISQTVFYTPLEGWNWQKVLGVWSADRSIAFENALSDAGFKWRRVAVDARGNDGGPEHTIYIARAGIEDRPLRTEMP
jgi:hypothetical protein